MRDTSPCAFGESHCTCGHVPPYRPTNKFCQVVKRCSALFSSFFSLFLPLFPSSPSSSSSSSSVRAARARASTFSRNPPSHRFFHGRRVQPMKVIGWPCSSRCLASLLEPRLICCPFNWIILMGPSGSFDGRLRPSSLHLRFLSFSLPFRSVRGFWRWSMHRYTAQVAFLSCWDESNRKDFAKVYNTLTDRR